jgi:hypothetical protein
MSTKKANFRKKELSQQLQVREGKQVDLDNEQ